jgi:hypothetical protein
MSYVLPRVPRSQLSRCLSSATAADRAQIGHASAVVRAVTAAGLAGAVLAVVLLVQGPAGPRPEAVLLTTASGTLEVGEPTVTLVHQAKEMTGMPPSAAHNTGGEVLVPVTLTNTSRRPLTYSTDQFHLLADGQRVSAGGGASSQQLLPNAGITLRLTFTATSLGHGARLQYEPTGGPPLVATLEPASGTPGTTSGTAGDAHGREGH